MLYNKYSREDIKQQIIDQIKTLGGQMVMVNSLIIKLKYLGKQNMNIPTIKIV